MAMQFEVVKAKINEILAAAAAGRFRTIGHQSQSVTALSIEGVKRTVRVYYSGGDFPKGASSANGPISHDITFNVELAVAEAGKIDIATLENPASTEAQKITAFVAAKEADELADTSWDEFFRIVWQILMDARNIDFGLPYEVANRWVSTGQKDKISSTGSMIVVTGVIRLELRVSEQVLGDAGDTPLEGFDIDMGIDDQDPVAEVSTTLP